MNFKWAWNEKFAEKLKKVCTCDGSEYFAYSVWRFVFFKYSNSSSKYNSMLLQCFS